MTDAPKLPRVRCAICDKPVDTVHIEQSFLKNSIFITVECHGDTDTMEIRFRDIRLIMPDVIEELFSTDGVAFAVKRKRLHQMIHEEAWSVFDVLDMGRS